MTLQKWIKDRAIHGYPSFSIEDVRGTGMYSSEQIMKNTYQQLENLKIQNHNLILLIESLEKTSILCSLDTQKSSVLCSLTTESLCNYRQQCQSDPYNVVGRDGRFGQ